MTIHLGTSKSGKPFSLPLDMVTQRLAILGRSGVGKSNTAAVAAEGMLKQHQQIVVIDPTGAWWGLRSSADGKSDGYPIVVIGGDHADVPLDHNAGDVLAKVIVKRQFSAVLDLENLRPKQRAVFVATFLESLYRLNRTPLHLFVDEADDIAPERPSTGESDMVAALEDVVKRGRKKGIGTTVITQRPQDLSKKLLTQCEMVVTMRLSHQLDIKAVAAWVNSHAETGMAKDMLNSLASLPTGTAWFWAPAWGDIFEEVKVDRRMTFDSGATPKTGQHIKAPERLATVDVAALGKEISTVVETAKAQDPKELKKRITELEKQLKQKPAPVPAPVVEYEPIDTSPLATNLADARDALATLQAGVNDASNAIAAAMDFIRIININEAKRFTHQSKRVTVAQEVRTIEAQSVPDRSNSIGGTVSGDGVKMSKSETAVLTALAQHGVPLDKARLACIAGYSPKGGGFGNTLSALRTAERIQGSNPIQITLRGYTDLGPFTPLPEGSDLLDYWMNHPRVGKAERQILEALAQYNDGSCERSELAMAAGYQPTGGGYGNALSKLRTLGLISGSSTLTLAEDLR